ncbi:hypothetical protein D3C81_1465530 [compost metagenome]
MSEGVGRVFVLIEPDVVGVLCDQLLDQTDTRIQVAAVFVTLIDHDHFGTQCLHEFSVRRRNVRVDHTDKPVTLGGADHGQRDPQIPRGRLDQASLMVNPALVFQVRDQGVCGLELD